MNLCLFGFKRSVLYEVEQVVKAFKRALKRVLAKSSKKLFKKYLNKICLK